MRIHDRPPRRQIEAYRNTILTTHTEWTTTAIGSPLATPTNFPAVFTTKARLYAAVFTTKARLHAAVFITKALLYTLRCLCTKARLYKLWCLTPKLYYSMLRCARTKATNYAAVFITNVLRPTLRCLRTNALLHMLRCLTPKLYKGCYGFYAKAAKTRCGVYNKSAECWDVYD